MVSLSGTGTVVTPAVFPGHTKTATLTNTGASALKIMGVEVSGSSSFYQTNTCGSSVATGASCTITVGFKKGSPPSSGTLMVWDNGGGSPQQVPVKGY